MIEGRGVGLRPLQSDDGQYLFAWYNDPRVLLGMGRVNQRSCVSMELERKSVQEMMKRSNEKHFMVVGIDEVRPMGYAALLDIDQKNASAEIMIIPGYMDSGVKGQCREAVGLLVGYGFDILNLHRIRAAVPEYNEALLDCLSRCGFRTEGRMRQDHYVSGEWRDTLLMGLLVEEWRGG